MVSGSISKTLVDVSIALAEIIGSSSRLANLFSVKLDSLQLETAKVVQYRMKNWRISE